MKFFNSTAELKYKVSLLEASVKYLEKTVSELSRTNYLLLRKLNLKEEKVIEHTKLVPFEDPYL